MFVSFVGKNSKTFPFIQEIPVKCKLQFLSVTTTKKLNEGNILQFLFVIKKLFVRKKTDQCYNFRYNDLDLMKKCYEIIIDMLYGFQ
jgi:hypothetical protein